MSPSTAELLVRLANECEECDSEGDGILDLRIAGILKLEGSGFTQVFERARSLSNWLLLGLSDIAADGMPSCNLGYVGDSGTCEVRGCGRDIITSLCAAGLRAAAVDLGWLPPANKGSVWWLTDGRHPVLDDNSRLSIDF